MQQILLFLLVCSRKSKRRGRRRSGSFDKPVTRGVGEYDTETDISLVGHFKRVHSRRKKMPEAEHGESSKRTKGEESTALNRSGPRRLLSHIKGLEIEEDGAEPPVTRCGHISLSDTESLFKLFGGTCSFKHVKSWPHCCV